MLYLKLTDIILKVAEVAACNVSQQTTIPLQRGIVAAIGVVVCKSLHRLVLPFEGEAVGESFVAPSVDLGCMVVQIMELYNHGLLCVQGLERLKVKRNQLLQRVSVDATLARLLDFLNDPAQRLEARRTLRHLTVGSCVGSLFQITSQSSHPAAARVSRQ